MSESSADLIKRYLEEARANEKALEAQYRSYAEGIENTEFGKVLVHCAIAASQCQLSLSERLEILGAASSLTSGLLGHLFPFHSRSTRSGVDSDAPPHEKLIAAFAAENGGIAFHEVLAIMAEASSDADTEMLARSIQRSKRELSEEIWRLVSAGHQPFPS